MKEAFRRFVTYKAVHTTVIVVIGDRCINIDALQTVHCRARASCPLQLYEQSVLIESKYVSMKYTNYIVAPLNQGGGSWPKQVQFITKNTHGADTPVLSYRWPFSALGEVPSAKDLKKTQGQ